MDAAVFLRKLADLIDMAQESPDKTKNDVGGNEDNFVDHVAIKSDETEVMVPPLQQKIELLKKLSGVDSVYDKTCDCEGECTCNAQAEPTDEEELELLKKNAGLAVVLDDDFPEE
jgi:hypothetical protein